MRRASATLPLLAAVALGGCGGSAKSLVKTDYIAKADAICKSAAARLNVVPTPLFDPLKATAKDLPEAAAYLASALTIDVGELNQLRGLPPSSEDAGLLQRALASSGAAVAQVRRAGEAARRGDVAGFRAAALTNRSAAAQSRRLARQFGFKVCGQAP